jgi:hypothetical protein
MDCLYRKVSKMEVLDKAYDTFIKILEEYAAQNNLSKEDRKALRYAIYHAYSEKKATYFLEERLSKFCSILDFSANFALKQDSKHKQNDYSIAYMKHLKQLINYQ